MRVWTCAVCQWLNGDRNQCCQSCGADRRAIALEEK